MKVYRFDTNLIQKVRGILTTKAVIEVDDATLSRMVLSNVLGYLFEVFAVNDIEMFVLMQENLHIVGSVIFNDFIIVVIVSLVAVAVLAKIWQL